ncbi:chromate transporter [Legionella sp. W05-934-2]|uniref:chromate transporter n=1 Tax=Legionella sp. W05-934-2 TaxID=1198649 RepID=UPI0034626994
MLKLVELMISFGKIGFTALGGGNSMLKLIEYEAVVSRQWVGQEEFVGMVGSTFLFPGLTAVKLSALIGYQVAGLLGLIIAVICLNLPGLLMALVGYSYLSQANTPITRKAIIAVQYGALAMLAAASYSIGESILKHNFSLPLICLTASFFILLAFFDLSPFWGLIGFIIIAYFLVL